MTSDAGMRRANLDAYEKESRWPITTAAPRHTHQGWSGLVDVEPYPGVHSHSFNPNSSKFDHKLVYYPNGSKMTFDATKLQEDVIIDIVVDDSNYKRSLKKMLNEELFRALDIPATHIPSQKENNMSSNGRQLLEPQSPVESKDLKVALRALEYGNGEEILDAVALVQSLEEGERLVQARKLKPQDVGCYVKVVAGPQGYLSDLSEDFGRGGPQKAVISGRMYDLRNDDLVIVSAPDQD